MNGFPVIPHQQHSILYRMPFSADRTAAGLPMWIVRQNAEQSKRRSAAKLITGTAGKKSESLLLVRSHPVILYRVGDLPAEHF